MNCSKRTPTNSPLSLIFQCIPPVVLCFSCDMPINTLLTYPIVQYTLIITYPQHTFINTPSTHTPQYTPINTHTSTHTYQYPPINTPLSTHTNQHPSVNTHLSIPPPPSVNTPHQYPPPPINTPPSIPPPPLHQYTPINPNPKYIYTHTLLNTHLSTPPPPPWQVVLGPVTGSSPVC